MNIALAVHTADKRARRDLTRDRWSRTIRLDLPVSDAILWSSAKVRDPLTRLLGYLTSDTRHLDFRSSDHKWSFDDGLEISSERVALFSGGLDSLCFAAAQVPQTTTLVSHFPRGGLGRIQRELAKSLGYADWQHAQFDTQILGPGNEQSSRSRGLLFMALGLVVCSGTGATELVVPENGLMAINLPLTRARPGACSTRSVHPRTIALMNEILSALELGCHIVNPFADRTKGEMCLRVINEDRVTPETLAASVSCGKPYAYNTAPYGNCGYCYPCLVRHASLNAAGIDRTVYRKPFGDVYNGHGSAATRADLTALRSWLDTPEPTEADLVAAGPWPSGADLTGHLSVIVRGRRELRAAWSR